MCISWFAVLEVLGRVFRLLGVGTNIHPEMLATLCAIFPSDKLVAQVLGVRIDWFEVLEVLEGECCLDHWM